MAKKEKGSSNANVMDMCAFVAVCVGGIALLVATILGKIGIAIGFVGVLQRVANAIGWAVLCILSTKFITTRKKIWLWVIWVAAVIMIILGTILPLFNF